MKLLLDTHVLVWALVEPARLSAKAQKRICEDACFVSAISAHELARLAALGRLEFKMPIAAWLAAAHEQLQFEWLPVHVPEATESYALPDFEHKDPCDRILLATARVHGIELATADHMLLNYRHAQTFDVRG